MEFKPKIVVTGFGPFSRHVINDSSSCAARMKSCGLQEELGVEIITEQIDVVYDNVLERVPDLWSCHDPFLMVHLGIHNVKQCITVEKSARKKGYCFIDTKKKCPRKGICPIGEKEYIQTEIDVDSIIAKCPPCQYELRSSEDAGLYLCEFIYYTSLSYNPSRSLFIHIPSYSGPDNLNIKVNAVKEIIKLAFIQLREKESWEKRQE